MRINHKQEAGQVYQCKKEYIVAYKLVLDFQLCAFEIYFQMLAVLFSAESFALHKVAAINVQLY